MTRKEALSETTRQLGNARDTLKTSKNKAVLTATANKVDYLVAVQAALRGPTREQVKQVRGEWIIEDAGNGDRRKKCSLCDTPISGWWGRDRFCPHCGAPMTDEAVDMMLERWKEAVSE